MFTIIKKNHYFVLFSITVFFAFLIRVIYLSQTPSGFHADEASFYVNAMSIAQTGMDEDANILPLSLASFIDPKPALFSYFQIPFIFLLKNQILAARFASVLLATVSLIVTYFFVRQLSNQKIAVISTMLLAISPWHIIVSRGTQEVITSFLFLVIALLFLIFILQKEKIDSFFSLFIFFLASFFSMYFYHSAKIVLPLLTISFISYSYLYEKSKNFHKKILSIVFLLLFALMLSFWVQESSSRVSAVSIFSDQGPQQKLIEQIYTSRGEVPVPVVRIFYNKIQAYSFAIMKEYTTYFSPGFLFFSESKPTRYNVPEHGLLYLVEIPLVILGLFIAIKNQKKEAIFFFLILFMSPIPASLTSQETPSLLRSFPMVIALTYFTALAINFLLEIEKKQIKYFALCILIGVYTWSTAYFALQYHVQARFTKPWFRNSPYTKIAKKVAILSPQYKRIEVTNDLRPLYAYFVMENIISIKELQLTPLARNNHNYTLGKVAFNKDVCEFEVIEPNVLYVTEVGCKEKNNKLTNLTTVEYITYDDDTPAYELLQLIQ